MKPTQFTIPSSLHKKLQTTANDLAQVSSVLYCNDLAAKLSRFDFAESFTGIDKYTTEPPEPAPILKLSRLRTGSGAYNGLTSSSFNVPMQEGNPDTYPSLPMYLADGKTKDATAIIS